LEARERAAEARIRGVRRSLETALANGDEASAPAIESKLREAIDAYREVQEEARAESPAWSKALSDAPTARIVDDVKRALDPGMVALAYHVGAARSFVFEIAPEGPIQCTELSVPAEIAAAWGIPAGPLTEVALERIVAQGRGPAPREGELAAPAETAGARPPAQVRGVGTSRPAEDSKAPENRARARDLAALGDVLLPPVVRARVFAAKRVHLVPDGVLHELPFEALRVGGAASADAAESGEANASGEADWLSLGPPICYGHSLSTLLEIRSRPRSLPADSIVLTVCDPEMGVGARSSSGAAPSSLADTARTGRWRPLPGTRRESEAVVRAYSRENVVRLSGKNAREGRVKELAPRARVLHLGTHGFVERERGDLLAALVLANEKSGAPEDGFLHLFEVGELGLSSDLVVLSACETKRGTRVRGEGVFALSRGFLAAGARRVVASLWPVDDDATAALMSAFFAELGRSGDPAASLMAAKREVRNREGWADPFYWAPFVLSGSF
jgi:hypothetical protein